MATAIYRLYFDVALWNNQDVSHNTGSAVTGVSALCSHSKIVKIRSCVPTFPLNLMVTVRVKQM